MATAVGILIALIASSIIALGVMIWRDTEETKKS